MLSDKIIKFLNSIKLKIDDFNYSTSFLRKYNCEHQKFLNFLICLKKRIVKLASFKTVL